MLKKEKYQNKFINLVPNIEDCGALNKIDDKLLMNLNFFFFPLNFRLSIKISN